MLLEIVVRDTLGGCEVYKCFKYELKGADLVLWNKDGSLVVSINRGYIKQYFVTLTENE